MHRCHPQTIGDDSCAWFGVISSSASAVGSVIESKKMLRVGSAQQETFGGYIDGDGGVMVRRKVSKLAQIIFNNQQKLVVVLEGSGGVAQMGAMRTNDHRGCDTSSLNDVVCIRGQGDRGTTIVRGIAYPCVVAAGVSI